MSGLKHYTGNYTALFSAEDHTRADGPHGSRSARTTRTTTRTTRARDYTFPPPFKKGAERHPVVESAQFAELGEGQVRWGGVRV